jgi:hypothetical protein
MNPTKVAAILALLVAIGAASDLIYQLAVVEPEHRKYALTVYDCQIKEINVEQEWKIIQLHIQKLRAEGRDREASKYELQHLGDEPTHIGCGDPELFPSPSYGIPSGIAIISLIASLALFGAAKNKRAET